MSGSAYTYSYAAFGEIIAWIIGWDLVMEYAVGNITVAISWSGNLTSFLHNIGVKIPGFLSNSFFDVKNYPVIRLASTKIQATNKTGTYMLNGQLTIKGKTQPVTFPFTANATADGYLFKGSFKMKRKDFGVGGTSTVSDELEVMINVTAKKDHPAA